MQRGDFEGLFAAMKGLPVTIRQLDPPLHEFLPNNEQEIAAVSAELNPPGTGAPQEGQRSSPMNQRGGKVE